MVAAVLALLSLMGFVIVITEKTKIGYSFVNDLDEEEEE